MTKVTNVSVLPDAAQNLAKAYKRREKKFGILEKTLILLSFVFAILFIAFFTLFIVKENYYKELMKKKICTSKECVESSMSLLQTIDFSQDPCQDFYKYACGNFAASHPAKENSLHNSWFAEKDERLNEKIMEILKQPIKTSDLNIVKQTKEFYQSCTNKSELNKKGLKPLYEILKLLELPNSIPNNTTIDNFNLGRTLALAQKYLSQDILVSLSITKEAFNFTSNFSVISNTFKLSPGRNELSVFDFWKSNRKIFSSKKLSRYQIKFNENEGKSVPFKNKFSSEQVIKATIKFIASILEKINDDLEADEEFTDEYNSNNFVTTAYKIITFSSNLYKETDNNETENSILNPEVTITTLSDFQKILGEEFSNSSLLNRIDWEEYFSTLLQGLNITYNINEESFIVENIEYFKHLSKILEEARPETIQRFIWWKIVEQYAKHTTSDIRAIYVNYYYSVFGESNVASRNQVCVNVMKNTMNVALSYEMSKLYNFTITSKKVLDMLNTIEHTFEKMVEATPWMDAQTKFITLDKAKAVRNEIGYPDWVTNSTKVEEFYKGLKLKKSDFLINLMRISHWEVENILETLGPIKNNSTNATTVWYINPLQVNAYYSHEDNAIIVPAGILQTPFYYRGLESLNYGALGTILGHELTHGFDIYGKNYNKFGERQENWWPEKIINEYETRAECFINQYQNYTLYEDVMVNGSFTLAENIADNGGIRESFRAYQLYVTKMGEEPKLPGFENFTHEQLLFLSYGNIWCETSQPKYYMFSQDSHSPHRVRVLASLQNLKEFSQAFNCVKNSFMNPSNKCILWYYEVFLFPFSNL